MSWSWSAIVSSFEQAEKAAATKDKQLNDLLARMMQYERVGYKHYS